MKNKKRTPVLGAVRGDEAIDFDKELGDSHPLFTGPLDQTLHMIQRNQVEKELRGAISDRGVSTDQLVFLMTNARRVLDRCDSFTDEGFVARLLAELVVETLVLGTRLHALEKKTS